MLSTEVLIRLGGPAITDRCLNIAREEVIGVVVPFMRFGSTNVTMMKKQDIVEN